MLCKIQWAWVGIISIVGLVPLIYQSYHVLKYGTFVDLSELWKTLGNFTSSF